MKARNQSSSPVSSTMMVCPVSGKVPTFEYDKTRKSISQSSKEIIENKFTKVV
jgi:hypothetical protein